MYFRITSSASKVFLSAESVKRRFPDLSVTLFTDGPDHVLCATGCFNNVEHVESTPGISSVSAAGKLNRLRCLVRTPYARTLHLDTDTRVLTEELPWLFGRLDDVNVALVEKAIDDSYSRRHLPALGINSSKDDLPYGQTEHRKSFGACT